MAATVSTEEASKLADELTRADSAKHEKIISGLVNLLCELNENEDEIDGSVTQEFLMQHRAFGVILGHLDNEETSGNKESLLIKCAQFIAELAKTESVREPLVKDGCVASLLKHLASENVLLGTQTCRALGNLCFDHELGRMAVYKGDGVSLILKLLSRQISSMEDGSARLRVIVCGFLLNLTNDCEMLQEKAIEAKVLDLLNECIVNHIDEDDLTNMALLTIGSITDLDSGKSAVSQTGLLDTFKTLLDRKGGENLWEPLLDLVNSILESEPAKEKAADNGLWESLVTIIEADGYSVEVNKTASDVLVSILVGDLSMEKLYDSGKGKLLKQCISWLDSDKDSLKTLGALTIGNFARKDSYCSELVDKGIVTKLVSLIKYSVNADSDFNLQHALLSSLRNLAIPVANKPRLLEQGVMEACLCLINSDIMPVVFKLLGLFRMLIEGQEAAALKLGQERAFLESLSEWCSVETHAGVRGESPRVIASLIKNSHARPVVQNLIRAECLVHLVTMAQCEHLVMQNEALLALTIVSTISLGDAAVAMKEVDLPEVISKILKEDNKPPEMLCNVFSLLRAISSAGNLMDAIINAGVIDQVRPFVDAHTDDKVREAATVTLTQLEASMGGG